jgi:hypothetical protein
VLRSSFVLALDGVSSCLVSGFRAFLFVVFVYSGSLVKMSGSHFVSSDARLC